MFEEIPSRLGDPSLRAQLLDSLEWRQRRETRERRPAVGDLEALSGRRSANPATGVLPQLSNPDPLHLLDGSHVALVRRVAQKVADSIKPQLEEASATVEVK
jgi:hypothetical protein